MLLLAAAAAFMPAHAAALNDLSSIPPVSLTMQPVNLAVVAAELVELADALDEVLVPDEAELWLLPHAAMTTRRRYGQRRRSPCAVFHAYLPWASTPQRLASHSSWVVPQAMPGGLPLGRGHAAI